MSGFYTEGLENVDNIEIVYPEKVSKDGSFVSYYLPHYYNMESTERPRRAPGFPTGPAKDAIHFFIPIGGEKHHLELWPNMNFISPALIVERRDARDIENINKAKISQISKRQCHYNGQIVGEDNSVAALSTCYGLTGYIRIPTGDEYLIEPVKDSKPTHNKEHPHIIYKRSAIKDKLGGSNCLTKGRAKEALEERMQWEALFGDKVQKEMSGINVNEIIHNSNRALSSQALHDNILSPNVLGSENKHSLANSNQPNAINLEENCAKTLNEHQLPENNVQGINPVQPLDSETPDTNAESLNRQFILGNKLKQNQFKEERSMGNVQLPDINSSPSKLVLNEMSEDNPGSWKLMNSEEKRNNNENCKHNRFKREAKCEKPELVIDKKEKLDDNDKKNGIPNNIKGEQSLNKIKSIKKINQRDVATVSSRSGISGHDQSNSVLQNQQKKIKRDANKLNHENKLNRAELENDEHVVVVFNDNTSSDQDKKSDNDEETKQTSRVIVHNSNSYDQSNEENHYSNNAGNYQKEKNPSDLSLDVISPPEEEKFDGPNQENNEKREIHLDTSEKSWKINEKSDKSNQEKKDKKKLQHTEHDKQQQDNVDAESLKQSENGLKGDKTKEFDTSKLINVDKHNLNDDESIMTSVVETVINDVNKLKVKKDIGINNILNDVKSTNKYDSQNQNILKVQDNMDGRIPKTNTKIYVSDTNNIQDKDQVVVNNQNVSFLKKEPSEDVLTNVGTGTGHVVEGVTTRNHGNIDEIVIKIKAPANSINSMKQTFKYDAENMKKGVDIVDVNKFKIVTDPAQNNQLSQKNLNILSNEKNKRGALDELDNGSSQNNQEVKIDLQNTNTDIQSQKQTKKENSDQSKENIKREDTIHLIIETEPEINNPMKNEANIPKQNLFCQGKNCLEIKPVVLNESNSAAIAPPSNNQSPMNSTNSEISKTKLLEKREVEEANTDSFEECAAETTTFKPLLCFDFLNKFFSLELMITVDYKVVKMHDDEDVENFILTIMNMVSTNFFDNSIEINLSVVLIRLILLTTCIKELDSNQFNPEELLENFCTWQVLINPGQDDHPHHHDLAIFVTRMEKCEGQMMGVTYMTSVCRPDKACLVCIDEGLLLANTITHQIGHSFGAEHDDGQSSGCSSTAPDGTSYYMAPTIKETSCSWSVCSQDAIVQFLRTQGSWCLTDQVSERTHNFPLMLPGQIYSAAQQCRLNFHMAALPCAIGAFCEKLYCQVTDKLCATKGEPPADGTFCAADMWCFHKECVHIGRRPGAVNGEWGSWTEWSTCTRSCGGGVSSSYRICNNPKPAFGGRYCIGDRMRHKMCATQPCQGFTESFRDLQCKKTEDRPFRGVISNWAQYHSFFLNIECSLVCQNRRGVVVMRSPIVADGTPCKAGTRNVCIQGTCRNVGCDWVIDSFAKDDACGVCHGNSTECKIIQGVFDERTNQRGMVEFLRVPKRSGMVFVRENAPSNNVLAVSGAINRVFYLNGKGNDESMPGDVAFGTTHGVYEVRSGMERIFIRGPTNEDLLFYVSFKEANRGVNYQYAVPELDPTYIPRYLWQYLDWDPCTDPCSGGAQRAQAKCVEDTGGLVDDHFCTQSTRPADIIRPCNEFPCRAKWWVSIWSDCICTGSTSIMFRSVLCMRATDESGTRAEIVKESECAKHKKPPSQIPCNETEDTSIKCSSKRSLKTDENLRSHKDMRRAINPNTEYIMSPANLKETNSQELEIMSDKIADKNENKDQIFKNTDQKNEIKSQDEKPTNGKGAVSKVKSKQNDKVIDPLVDSKKKVALIKHKSNDPQKLAGIYNSVEHIKDKKQTNGEALSMVTDSLKQIVNLKSDSALEGPSNQIKRLDISKQGDESDTNANSTPTGSSVSGEKCDSTNIESGTSAQESDITNSLTTCKQTIEIVPHEKTTCRKTTLNLHLQTYLPVTTTLRPVKTNFDELDTNSFAITVVAVEPAPRDKLPQSDPEYIRFGNVGEFKVVDENNGTILTGQQAIDFLQYARNNASEEPPMLIDNTH